MLRHWLHEQALEQIKGRGVHPLKIVEEYHERMLSAGEHREKSQEYKLKSVLIIL